jgi:hypothetical protein
VFWVNYNKNYDSIPEDIKLRPMTKSNLNPSNKSSNITLKLYIMNLPIASAIHEVSWALPMTQRNRNRRNQSDSTRSLCNLMSGIHVPGLANQLS